MKTIRTNQIVGKALDVLALALADENHHWSDEERLAYEQAIALLEDAPSTEETLQ
ncbi:MAG TPA: hypothetical protein VFU31_29885 [Candidatus Binatia bacterium]|nr:hypothetical protein [Candidatus Binatia bacterium]